MDGIMERTAWGSYQQEEEQFLVTSYSSPTAPSAIKAWLFLAGVGLIAASLAFGLLLHAWAPAMASIPPVLSLLPAAFIFHKALAVEECQSFPGVYRGGPVEAFLEAGNPFSWLEDYEDVLSILKQAQRLHKIARSHALPATAAGAGKLFSRKLTRWDEIFTLNSALGELEKELSKTLKERSAPALEKEQEHLRRELAPAFAELSNPYSLGRPLAELAHSNDLR